MARRKIVPEEEVSKPAMAEETTATDVDDEAPADLMPDSNAEESATSEAVPTETLLEGINGNDAEGSVQAEKSESISAEKASEEAMSVEDASVSEEELPAGSEHADASIEEVTTEPESASDALSEAAILCDADEDGNMRCAMKDIPIWHRMSFSSAAMKNRMMRFWVQQSSTTMLWKSTTVSSLPFSTKRSMAMSFYSRLMPKLPRRISGRKLIEGNCKKLQQLPIFL